MLFSHLFSPVLRSLARLRPDMTLEDGVPRAVQEWEHSSNFERMIFYEMAEKFMEFEVEEEQQIQKMKLLASCSQFQAPLPKSTKPTPSPATESGQQQVYIPKKAAAKSRQPRRRQRRSPSAPAPGAPREIPAEAVHQYAEIMEALDTSWEEEEDEKKAQRGRGDPRDQEDGMFPDPSLLQYIDQLCGDEEFVCKVEAGHPPTVHDWTYCLSGEKPMHPHGSGGGIGGGVELDRHPVNACSYPLYQTTEGDSWYELVEKRLLVLSEEERERSFCPTSHSDSTPFQSEDEDEVGNSGKGEETPCKAMKRPPPSKGIRASQPETAGAGTGSLLVPSSQQHLGKRDFLPKAVRTPLGLSPHKCDSRDAQEESMLPALKNTDERETPNLQKHSQVGFNLGLAKEISLHAQWEKIGPSVTEHNSLSRHPNSQVCTGGQGSQRPRSTGCAGGNGRDGTVKGQEEVRRDPEQVSHTAKVESHEETQLVWQNLEPAHNTCGKQDDTQQRQVKHEKRALATWGGQEHRITCANQNINKTLLGDHTSKHGALQQNLNRYGELPFEKITGQSQSRGIMESEDTSSGTDVDNEGTGMKSQRDGQISQFSKQLDQLGCQKQDGCQQEVLQDHTLFLASRKGPTSALNAAGPHCGSIVSCGKRLAGQELRTPVPAGPGKQHDAPEAKVGSQKKSQVSWEKTKCAPVKRKRSSGKALRCCADNLALPTPFGQDGHQPSCPPILETDQKVNYPVFTPSTELSGGKGNPLTSADPTGGRELKDELPRTSTEHPPFSSRSGLASPSLSIQMDPGMFPEGQWPISDQGEVNPQVGNQPGVRQTPNPTLNPSDCIVAVEAAVDNGVPSGDPTLVPSSSCKTALPPKLGNSNVNNPQNQKAEHGNLLSFKDQSEEASSESERNHLGQGVGRRDLLEPATKTSTALPELSGGNVESSHPYVVHEDHVEEEDEEDEELSGFSSLLASKLSLSSHFYDTPFPKEQDNTVPASPTETGKPDSKVMHSGQVQVPQEAIVLLHRNLGAHPTVHRSHKRKSYSSGIRRSKRLRDQ
uniref:Uncharacterized protein n=1 Tax=Sphaerodactylus townsendi TaxID=933632 RepID=A0ACB8EVR7_9SAUR